MSGPAYLAAYDPHVESFQAFRVESFTAQEEAAANECKKKSGWSGRQQLKKADGKSVYECTDGQWDTGMDSGTFGNDWDKLQCTKDKGCADAVNKYANSNSGKKKPLPGVRPGQYNSQKSKIDNDKNKPATTTKPPPSSGKTVADQEKDIFANCKKMYSPRKPDGGVWKCSKNQWDTGVQFESHAFKGPTAAVNNRLQCSDTSSCADKIVKLAATEGFPVAAGFPRKGSRNATAADNAQMSAASFNRSACKAKFFGRTKVGNGYECTKDQWDTGVQSGSHKFTADMEKYNKYQCTTDSRCASNVVAYAASKLQAVPAGYPRKGTTGTSGTVSNDAVTSLSFGSVADQEKDIFANCKKMYSPRKPDGGVWKCSKNQWDTGVQFESHAFKGPTAAVNNRLQCSDTSSCADKIVKLAATEGFPVAAGFPRKGSRNATAADNAQMSAASFNRSACKAKFFGRTKVGNGYECTKDQWDTGVQSGSHKFTADMEKYNKYQCTTDSRCASNVVAYAASKLQAVPAGYPRKGTTGTSGTVSNDAAVALTLNPNDDKAAEKCKNNRGIWSARLTPGKDKNGRSVWECSDGKWDTGMDNGIFGNEWDRLQCTSDKACAEAVNKWTSTRVPSGKKLKNAVRPGQYNSQKSKIQSAGGTVSNDAAVALTLAPTTTTRRHQRCTDDANPRLVGDKCEPCPAGTTYDIKNNWCSQGTNAHPNCKPDKPYWKGNKCEACPVGTKYDYNSNFCAPVTVDAGCSTAFPKKGLKADTKAYCCMDAWSSLPFCDTKGTLGTAVSPDLIGPAGGNRSLNERMQATVRGLCAKDSTTTWQTLLAEPGKAKWKKEEVMAACALGRSDMVKNKQIVSENLVSCDAPRVRCPDPVLLGDGFSCTNKDYTACCTTGNATGGMCRPCPNCKDLVAKQGLPTELTGLKPGSDKQYLVASDAAKIERQCQVMPYDEMYAANSWLSKYDYVDYKAACDRGERNADISRVTESTKPKCANKPCTDATLINDGYTCSNSDGSACCKDARGRICMKCPKGGSTCVEGTVPTGLLAQDDPVMAAATTQLITSIDDKEQRKGVYENALNICAATNKFSTRKMVGDQYVCNDTAFPNDTGIGTYTLPAPFGSYQCSSDVACGRAVNDYAAFIGQPVNPPKSNAVSAACPPGTTYNSSTKVCDPIASTTTKADKGCEITCSTMKKCKKGTSSWNKGKCCDQPWSGSGGCTDGGGPRHPECPADKPWKKNGKTCTPCPTGTTYDYTLNYCTVANRTAIGGSEEATGMSNCVFEKRQWSSGWNGWSCRKGMYDTRRNDDKQCTPTMMCAVWHNEEATRKGPGVIPVTGPGGVYVSTGDRPTTSIGANTEVNAAKKAAASKILADRACTFSKRTNEVCPGGTFDTSRLDDKQCTADGACANAANEEALYGGQMRKGQGTVVFQPSCKSPNVIDPVTGKCVASAESQAAFKAAYTKSIDECKGKFVRRTQVSPGKYACLTGQWDTGADWGTHGGDTTYEAMQCTTGGDSANKNCAILVGAYANTMKNKAIVGYPKPGTGAAGNNRKCGGETPVWNNTTMSCQPSNCKPPTSYYNPTTGMCEKPPGIFDLITPTPSITPPVAAAPSGSSQVVAGAPVVPTCTGNSYLENNACKDCGIMVVNKDKNGCDCPGGKEWQNNQCLCPAGTEEKNGTCEALQYIISDERGGLDKGKPYDIHCSAADAYITKVHASYDNGKNVVKGMRATCSDNSSAGQAGTFTYQGYDTYSFESTDFDAGTAGFDKAGFVTTTNYKNDDAGGTKENAVRAIGFGKWGEGDTKMYGSSGGVYTSNWDKKIDCNKYGKAPSGKKYVLHRMEGRSGHNIDSIKFSCKLVNQ